MPSIAQYWRGTTGIIMRHKVWSAVTALCFVGGLWWLFGALTSTSGQPRYVLGSVAQGTIVASVSASGQVAANQQLDLKPKVSGEIVYVGATAGQQVSAGTLIAEIDPTDAQKAVRDAQANLQSAQLALAKLQEPATTLTLTQQQNALSQAQAALTTQYQSSFSDVTSTFLDLPTIISALQSIDLGTDASGGAQWNIDYYADQASKYNPSAPQYRDIAYSDYQAARTSYDQTFADFKSLSATPDQATIEKILQETYTTASLVATAAKSSNDLIQFYSDQLTRAGATPKAIAAVQITNLQSYQTKAQAHITALLSDTNSLQSDKDGIAEKQQTLDQTKAGADAIDVQSAQLNVTKAQNALADAQTALADYYIRAPFGGTVASVAVHKFDQAGSGSAVATLITPQMLADLSLNEVDAAKIQLGDKVTLTFDAIPNLTLTGTVAEIDPVGAVSQGVVSYDVKISFDAQNNEIKSGMTVNAQIQTGVHQNVLIVPQSAVKTQSGQSYVLVFNPPLATSTATSQGTVTKQVPEQVPVEVGLSSDTSVEITSGLTEGQQIVTRTVTGTATTQTTTTGSSNRGLGGGGIRIP